MTQREISQFFSAGESYWRRKKPLTHRLARNKHHNKNGNNNKPFFFFRPSNKHKRMSTTKRQDIIIDFFGNQKPFNQLFLWNYTAPNASAEKGRPMGPCLLKSRPQKGDRERERKKSQV
jgi:hypothetical protein